MWLACRRAARSSERARLHWEHGKQNIHFTHIQHTFIEQPFAHSGIFKYTITTFLVSSMLKNQGWNWAWCSSTCAEWQSLAKSSKHHRIQGFSLKVHAQACTRVYNSAKLLWIGQDGHKLKCGTATWPCSAKYICLSGAWSWVLSSRLQITVSLTTSLLWLETGL